MRTGLSVVLLLAPWSAQADVILVLGEGDAVADALDARDVDARRPAEVQSALEERRRRARPDRESARVIAREGREAYTNLEFDVAVSKLGRAIEATLASGADDVDMRELTALHLDLGIALLAADEREAGEREIALALRQKDAPPVDRAVHGPPTLRAVERVRRLLGKARVSRLEVTTEPAGATIRLDGEDRGAGPAVLEGVAQGSHYVEATKQGRRTMLRRIEVDAAAAPVALELPEARPEDRAMAALTAGRQDEAAVPARDALGAEGALVVRRTPAGLAGWYAPRDGAEKTATAQTAEALVTALFGEQQGASAAAPSPANGAPEPARPARDREDDDGGPPWWAIIGGVVVVGAGAALLLLGGDDADQVDLVPEIQRR